MPHSLSPPCRPRRVGSWSIVYTTSGVTQSYRVNSLLTTLFLQKFPDRFIVHLWNKNIGGVSPGIDDTRRTFFFGVSAPVVAGELVRYS